MPAPGAPPCVLGGGLGQRPEARGRGPESGRWGRERHQRRTHTPGSLKVEWNHLTAGRWPRHGPREPVAKPWAPCATVLVPPCCRPSPLPWWPRPPPPFPESPLHRVPAPRRAPDPLAHVTDVGSLCRPLARPTPELLTLALNDADKPLPGPRPAPLPSPPARPGRIPSEGFCGLSHLVGQDLQLQNHVC